MRDSLMQRLRAEMDIKNVDEPQCSTGSTVLIHLAGTHCSILLFATIG
jgi:hypothetical protein